MDYLHVGSLHRPVLNEVSGCFLSAAYFLFVYLCGAFPLFPASDDEPGRRMMGKYDLQNWNKGKVSLFQALGFKGATYPEFKPRLASEAAVNSPGPARFGQTQSAPAGGQGQADIHGYKNPIGPGLIPARIDMGVDYTGSGPLYALGDGTITNVSNSGWPGGTFIGLKLNNGKFVYYAENIAPSVRVGQRVKAGDVVGHARGSSPWVEVGWAAPPGTGETMAAKSGESARGQAAGDPGRYSTGFGVAFSNLIKALGGKPGIVSPGGVSGSAPSGY